MRKILILTLVGAMAAQPALARGGHRHSHSSSTGNSNTTTTQPSTSVTTSTDTSTGVTTTTATSTGGTTVSSGASQGGHHSNNGTDGHNALDRAKARATDEQTEERYDDRYFNAARERQKEIDRASNPTYTGPSAADHVNAVQYGVTGPRTETTNRGAFEEHIHTGPFEGEDVNGSRRR